MQTVYDKAQAFYEKGMFHEALGLFHEMADSWPDFSVLNYIGCCYIGTKDYKTAESVFNELISEAPDWERPYFNLARVYLAVDKDREAYELLKRAIEINPFDEDSYFYMGVYYRKKSMWNEAVDCFLKSEKLNTEDFEVHLNLSACYAAIGDCEKALTKALKALEIDPEGSDAVFNVSKILIDRKEYERAFHLLYENRAVIGDDIGLLKNLFRSALKAGNLDVCTETAQTILSLDQNDLMMKRFLDDVKD